METDSPGASLEQGCRPELPAVACDCCGEDIEPHQIEAATQVPPDYMPEDFRRRAAMLMCEPCREAQFERQAEGA